MISPLVKQSDAIHMATRDLYSSAFGQFLSEPPHDTGFYSLISQEIKKAICSELGIIDFDHLPSRNRIKILENVQQRYHQFIEREDEFGENYLYHKAFFKAFLKKAEYEKYFGLPLYYYLEQNYAPTSSFRPKQLDTYDDYHYLAEKIRESLSYSDLDLTDYQKHYLLNSLEWFINKAVELKSQESEPTQTPQVQTASVCDMPVVVTTPAPPQVSRLPITIDDLCLPSFTPADLTELLLLLEAIPKDLPHKWNKQPVGKAAGAQSKIAAALTVLSQESSKLFSRDSDLWTEAIKDAYGITLGKAVLDYEYGFSATKTKGSDAFDTATTETNRWLKRWKSNKK